MSNKVKIDNVHSSEFGWTKIIATVGPSTNSYDSIKSLILAGANGIRLNFSHGNHEEREQQIKWIRKAEKELGTSVAVIQDLQGPKIRLGDFDGVIPVQAGQNITLKYNSDYKRTGLIPTQYDLSKKVKRGERVFFYDGKVKSTVISVKDGKVHVRLDNDGVLLERKGINLPDTDFGGDVITAKDRHDAAFGSDNDVDYVAQSFVQTQHDIDEMKKILKNLGSSAKVIAKIETVSALERIDQIVDSADAVMVARGDLAIETSPELVPIEQRRIVGVCRQKAKPVIIATQMLATMTESSEPTRAEVSDVATAVIIGSDCVMLSDETANGRFPLEAVKMMKTVVSYAERNSPITPLFRNQQNDITTTQSAICSAIIALADEIKVTAIVAETKSGATALNIAARRPDSPIITVTSQQRVANQMAIVYGIKSYVRPDGKLAATKLTNWLVKNGVLRTGDKIVTASGMYPGVVGATDTIKVRVI